MATRRIADRNVATAPPAAAVAALTSAAEPRSPDAPDYRSPQYRVMEAVWDLCADMKGGTAALRAKGQTYLPKMESENVTNYSARLDMTFASDHYATTLDDLVGLPFSVPPVYGERIPAATRALFSNIDGRGTDMDVYLRRAFREQLDGGHVVLMADYPPVPDQSRLSLQDVKDRKIRPYLSIVRAQDVLSWLVETIGGEEVVTQVVLRECGAVKQGAYGIAEEERYRVLRQEVQYEPNEYTGDDVAVGLGAMTWELWRPARPGEFGKTKGSPKFVRMAEGAIDGPKRLPIRIAYAEQLGTLYSRPFLGALAWVQLEEWQVQSEYANIMHKCNVPTPVFIGRNTNPVALANGTQKAKVTMGEGIDIPQGGNALMLEPSGVALEATRQRIQDLKTEAKRHGAAVSNDDTELTATEFAIIQRQRNARLAVAVRSLNDAAEGAVADLAAFQGQTLQLVKPESDGTGDTAKGGGSVQISTDFAGAGYDATFVTECRNAWMEGALPTDAYLHVLKTGKLPDDFDPSTTAALMDAARQAEEDAQAAAEQAALDAAAATGREDPNAPPAGGTAKKKPAAKKAAAKTAAGRNTTPGDRAGKRAAKKSAGV